ncbi:Rz-like spanin [Xanthomonas phage XaC1]|nr:Rz-like spanin [Xanthomonas phage XaC1]
MEVIYKYFIAAGLGVLYSILLAFGGWKAHVWYTGYEQNKLSVVKDAVQETRTLIVSEIAKKFEDQKVVLENNNEDVRQQLKKVTVKNVYQNVCIDQDGVDILKTLKSKSSAVRGFTDDKK